MVYERQSGLQKASVTFPSSSEQFPFICIFKCLGSSAKMKGIYELYCNHPPGGDWHILASYLGRWYGIYSYYMSMLCSESPIYILPTTYSNIRHYYRRLVRLLTFPRPRPSSYSFSKPSSLPAQNFFKRKKEAKKKNNKQQWKADNCMLWWRWVFAHL